MTLPDSRIAREPAPSTTNAALRKIALRSELLARRDGLSQAARRIATKRLGDHLIEWEQRCRCATLAVFWPIRGEPDLTARYDELTRCGVQLALPVVTAVDAPLVFVAWTPGKTMMCDAFGVAIPALPHRLTTPDAVLVPCVGFNPGRVRLGYGGGFYDRTLAELPAAATIGIAFDCARAEFDAEAHDIALHNVITESGIF